MRSRVEKTIDGLTKLWCAFCARLSVAQRFFGKQSALAVLLLLAVGLCGFGSTPDYTQIEKEIKEGKRAAARQELERLVKANPKDYQAQVLLGIVLDEQGESQVATIHFNIAERLRPNDSQIHETQRLIMILASFSSICESRTKRFSNSLQPGAAHRRTEKSC